MGPTIKPVQTSKEFPLNTTVVVIGGGIVGLTAALTLSERGIPVVVLEKGQIAGEQSSRNLGWIRKSGRAPLDAPMAVAAEKLWEQMAERTGSSASYRQAGMVYLSRTEAELGRHIQWQKDVKDLNINSKIISSTDINKLIPGGCGSWFGGIYTKTDGYAEPTLAASAIAKAAIEKGAIIIENCAVRSISKSAGNVSGVVTEKGEIKCDQALLAGGMWSRRFLGNMGIALPILPVVGHVLRTAPMDGPTDIAVAGHNFSFRKRTDGGFTITQRAAMCAPITIDHAKIGLKYLPTLKANWRNIRVQLGQHFLNDLALSRKWSDQETTPFEKIRTLDPTINNALIKEAMDNLKEFWPVFDKAIIEETWAGTIDITPDFMPVICPAPNLPGLTLATGFSGHGFGTSPASGQLAADLIMNAPPIVDPKPYRIERFS